MASALLKQSVTDLTRRKARTVFTVLTLAIAVASVGIFAIPSLMDRRCRGRCSQPAARPDRSDEAAARSRARSWRRCGGCRTSPPPSRAATSRRASGSASGA